MAEIVSFIAVSDILSSHQTNECKGKRLVKLAG